MSCVSLSTMFQRLIYATLSEPHSSFSRQSNTSVCEGGLCVLYLLGSPLLSASVLMYGLPGTSLSPAFFLAFPAMSSPGAFAQTACVPQVSPVPTHATLWSVSSLRPLHLA